MTACSWDAGWRSLLLRAYNEPITVNEFITPATADHLIVLVTGGACHIEGRYRGGWHSTHYEVGDIGMTSPGQEVALRWRGETAHNTLQLHLPTATIQRVLQDFTDRDPFLFEMPSMLTSRDPLIQHLMLNLVQALGTGAPDLYAETAGDMLVAHLLVRHAAFSAPRPLGREDLRLCRANAFIRENLGVALTLEAIAEQAGVSRFHLVRLFKRAYGESPLKRVTRLRMEEAQRLLTLGHISVTEIAFQCGYENPAHFASAFRRFVGIPPSSYRREIR